MLSEDRGGITIEAFVSQIHKTLVKEFNFAHVWGCSSKHYPQRYSVLIRMYYATLYGIFEVLIWLWVVSVTNKNHSQEGVLSEGHDLPQGLS